MWLNIIFITLNQNSNQNLLFRFVGNSLTTSMKTLLASISACFDTLRPKCATQIFEVASSTSICVQTLNQKRAAVAYGSFAYFSPSRY